MRAPDEGANTPARAEKMNRLRVNPPFDNEAAGHACPTCARTPPLTSAGGAQTPVSHILVATRRDL